MLEKLEALQRAYMQRLSEALLNFQVEEDAARTVLERNEQVAREHGALPGGLPRLLGGRGSRDFGRVCLCLKLKLIKCHICLTYAKTCQGDMTHLKCQ